MKTAKVKRKIPIVDVRNATLNMSIAIRDFFDSAWTS
jgi:hypothetical protein